MAVKEREYVARSIGGTNEARTDQTLPFVGADEPHAVQFTDVVSKLGLQVAYFFILEHKHTMLEYVAIKRCIISSSCC